MCISRKPFGIRFFFVFATNVVIAVRKNVLNKLSKKDAALKLMISKHVFTVFGPQLPNRRKFGKVIFRKNIPYITVHNSSEHYSTGNGLFTFSICILHRTLRMTIFFFFIKHINQVFRFFFYFLIILYLDFFLISKYYNAIYLLKKVHRSTNKIMNLLNKKIKNRNIIKMYKSKICLHTNKSYFYTISWVSTQIYVHEAGAVKVVNFIKKNYFLIIIS